MIEKINLNNIDNVTDNDLISKEEIMNDLNNNPFGIYLTLIENNEIIGYLYYSDIYDRAEINQIEVSKKHRNCGKGSLLLKKMIELVEKDITLEVRKNNYSAINLYKKFNFKEIAIRKNYYNNIDGILMERKYNKDSY